MFKVYVDNFVFLTNKLEMILEKGKGESSTNNFEGISNFNNKFHIPAVADRSLPLGRVSR